MNHNACALYFETNPAHQAHLADRDPHMARAMRIIGPIRRRMWTEPFPALLRAVIGQQISAKAQDAVWLRFCATFPHFDAAVLATTAPESICQCGISRRKANYLQGIAQAFASGALVEDELWGMSDKQLQQTLPALPGIGPWTVEMLLIFTFGRPNVLSFGDLAIRRGMTLLYGHEKITREIFNAHLAVYAPCATLAGMYLWAVAAPGFEPGLVGSMAPLSQQGQEKN